MEPVSRVLDAPINEKHRKCRSDGSTGTRSRWQMWSTECKPPVTEAIRAIKQVVKSPRSKNETKRCEYKERWRTRLRCQCCRLPPQPEGQIRSRLVAWPCIPVMYMGHRFRAQDWGCRVCCRVADPVREERRAGSYIISGGRSQRHSLHPWMLSEACSLSTESAILVSEFPFGKAVSSTLLQRARKIKHFLPRDGQGKSAKELTFCRCRQWHGWCRGCWGHQIRARASYGGS